MISRFTQKIEYISVKWQRNNPTYPSRRFNKNVFYSVFITICWCINNMRNALDGVLHFYNFFCSHMFMILWNYIYIYLSKRKKIALQWTVYMGIKRAHEMKPCMNSIQEFTYYYIWTQRGSSVADIIQTKIVLLAFRYTHLEFFFNIKRFFRLSSH